MKRNVLGVSLLRTRLTTFLFGWKASSPSSKHGKTGTNHAILTVSVKEHEHGAYIGLKSWLRVNPDVKIPKSVGQATKIAQIPGNPVSKGLEGLFNVGLIAFPAFETLLWLSENLLGGSSLFQLIPANRLYQFLHVPWDLPKLNKHEQTKWYPWIVIRISMA